MSSRHSHHDTATKNPTVKKRPVRSPTSSRGGKEQITGQRVTSASRRKSDTTPQKGRKPSIQSERRNSKVKHNDDVTQNNVSQTQNTEDHIQETIPIQEDDTHQEQTIEDPVDEKITLGQKQNVPSGDIFDVLSFNSDIGEFCEIFSSPKYNTVDIETYPVDDLISVVSAVSTTIDKYKSHTRKSQQHLEDLTARMKSVRKQIHLSVTRKAFEIKLDDDDLTVEEAELNTKLSRLNAEVARANINLAEAVKLSADTEGATVRALIAVEKARAEAKRIEEEIELKAKLEAERRETEKRRREEERRLVEEERRRLLKDKREKEIRWRKKAFGMEGSVVWENWPVHEYPIQDQDENTMTCLIRGHPSGFSARDVECQVIDQMETILSYEPLEEMISCIVQVTQVSSELKEPIYVSIPHNMTRVSAASRECVVKGEESGEWKELPTTEVTFETFKDMKFAQAEVKHCTSLAVFSRPKRDHIIVSRKAAKIVSSYDHRVTITTSKGTFTDTERLLLQVLPIDSGSIHEFRSRNIPSKSLLTSSPLVLTDWESKEFNNSVEVTIPCPPNPAKAKKMAAIRAAKEAKMRNPKSALDIIQEQEKEKESLRRKQKQAMQEEVEEKKQTRWYMGEYANSDDDENDLLFLVAKTGASKWYTMDNVEISQIKLDVIQFLLPRPVDRFMVIRTRTNVSEQSVVNLATELEIFLSQRMVQVVCKQSGEDPFDAVLHISPVHKVEKLEKDLKEDGYDAGPSVTSPFFIEEGELIHINFRGNVQSEKQTYHVTYNSNVRTCVHFTLSEVDKYLQKNFAEYRGYIQIYKNNKLICSFEPKNFRSDGSKVQVQQRPSTKEFLCEIMVQVPKINLDQISSPMKAPVQISSGPVGGDLMRYIATELRDDWKMVANSLNVNRVRIQSIQRNINNGDYSEEDGRYEMLTTWLKRMPKADDKVSVLCAALVRCGRSDLSQYIKERRQSSAQDKRTELKVED